jgi:hypothetical protein
MTCFRHLSCSVASSLAATCAAVVAVAVTSAVASANLDSLRRLGTTTPYMYVLEKHKALPD